MRLRWILILCFLLIFPFWGISDELKGAAKSPIYTGLQPPDAMDDIVAVARQRDSWNPALRDVETVQIISKVHFENVKEEPWLPVVPLIANTLNLLGLKTEIGEISSCDVQINLTLTCRPLGKKYPEGLLYTGAYVEGKISFQAKNLKIEENFSGEVEPPDTMPEWQKSNLEQYRDPKSAPFRLALSQPGSLVEKLARIYYRAFGKYALVIMFIRGDPVFFSPYYASLDPLLKEIGEPLLEPFLYLLQSRMEGITTISAHALGVLKSPKAIPALVALASKGINIDKEVANAVLRCAEEPGGVEQLLLCLKDNNAAIRERTVQFLREIKGEKAIEGLLTALRDKSPGVRRFAVEAFLLIKDKRAVEPLIKILQNSDEDDQIRALAARALGEIGDERAYEPLLEIVKRGQESFDLRDSASAALKKIPKSPLPLPQVISKWRSAVEHNEKSEISNYEEQLKRREPAVIDHLLPIIENPMEKKALRLSALKILCEFKDKRLIKPFLAIAKNEHEGVEERGLAIKGLGINKAKEASDFLLSLLTNNKELSVLRASSAIALGDIGEERAIEPLYTLLKTKPPIHLPEGIESGFPYYEESLIYNSPDGYIFPFGRENLRQPSALALAKIGKPALPRITDALKDEDPEVRKIMIWALWEIKEDWAKELIYSSIDDPDMSVVLYIADLLTDRKDPKAADAILKILESETADISLKGMAIETFLELRWQLKGFADRRFIEPLKRFLITIPLTRENNSQSAMSLLAEFKDPSSLEAIARFLYSEEESLRESAIDVIGEIGDIAPVVKDLAYISKNDESADIRLEAIKLLTRSPDPIAIQALCDAIKYDPEYTVQINAVETLMKWKPPEAVEPLAQFIVKHKDEPLRKEIAKALSQIDATRAAKAIIPSLQDNDPKVRIGAAEALALIGAKEGVEPLIDLLIDENKDVRESARNALKEIVGVDYGYDVGRWRFWWEEYKKELLRRGEKI